MKREITLTVNGEKKTIKVDFRQSLLDVIREDLGLTGAKQGCGVGECGACAVLVNGETIDSCIYLAVWADGKEIRTIESLEEDGELSNMQKAFVDEGAVQCGICTPGILMTATEMEESGKSFSEEDIKRALSGHLCRCTGYTKIIAATKTGLKNVGRCSCEEKVKEV